MGRYLCLCPFYIILMFSLTYKCLFHGLDAIYVYVYAGTKQHLVSVFFDLVKADDTTWKCGIIKDLKDTGL